MTHICILTWLIISIGSLAGLTNYLRYYFQGQVANKLEFIKYILSGIGAAVLVPLLLNMLSSNLIQETADYDPINYFVFAGFCFVAGYFSDRFISTIGDRVLKDLENTNKKVEQMTSTVKQNEEKLNILVSSESDPEELEEKTEIDLSQFKEKSSFTDDDVKTQINKIVKALDGKYKFRTAKGVAKELGYNLMIIEHVLNGLQEQGILKAMVDKDGKVLWTLTQIGKMFAQSVKV